MSEGKIKECLKNLSIEFVEHKHPAVYTVEEARKYIDNKNFLHCKNLFVKDRKSRRFYLIILPAGKSLSLSEFEEILEERLKFANEDNLRKILNVYPGSVSPFSLINDDEHKVIVIVDKALFLSGKIGFHPNDNAKTWVISGEDFKKYLDSLDNEIRLI